ncbi:MAG TPA: ABC transporter permease [Dehalococcoidia bacterium]
MASSDTVLIPELGAAAVPRGRGRGRRVLSLVRKQPLGVFGLAVILVLAVAGLAAPWLAPYEVNDIGAGQPLEGMSWAHPFGTDSSGRDMLSRVIYGARISLAVGFLSVIGGTAIATAIGIFSGYVGGWVDNVIQRVADTLIAFPALIFLLILVTVLGPSMRNVILVIGIGIIPGVSRVVRGAVLSEKQNQYVEAARALGASTPRILFRHLLPNVAALAIVIMTTLLGTAILAEASLSFLGLGIPPPNPSWGADVNAARNSFPIHIPWAFFPGAAISLTVLGFNFLGDALRDLFDPRLRGR